MQTIAGASFFVVALCCFFATAASAQLSSSAGPDRMTLKSNRAECCMESTGAFRVTADGVSCDFKGLSTPVHKYDDV
ncbi:MAG: hypothetical protein AB1696_26285 [Planctomycetota bacterium]